MDKTLVAVGNSADNGTDSLGDTESAGTADGDTDADSDSDTEDPLACPVDLVGWASVDGDGLFTTDGGGSATPVRPTTLEELQALAADTSPQVIEIEGTFDTGSEYLEIGSNKTLVGVDSTAMILGGIRIRDASNVIVRNLTVQGDRESEYPGDVISVGGSHHVWVDHCDLSNAYDGILDITDGSDFCTVSWTVFTAVNQSCLVGGSSEDGATDEGKNNVTWHHNWFKEDVVKSMPRALFGKIHIFNSYYTAVDNSYCIGAGSYGGVLIEANYFDGVQNPHIFADVYPAHITVTADNIYNETTGGQEEGYNNGDTDGVESFPDSSPYAYTPDPAEESPALVERCAGPQ